MQVIIQKMGQNETKRYSMNIDKLETKELRNQLS